MDKEIRNKNNKGKHHGYQEWYQTNNKIVLRGNFKNDNLTAYYENHLFETTIFFIR